MISQVWLKKFRETYQKNESNKIINDDSILKNSKRASMSIEFNNLLWHDQNIYNKENEEYYAKYFQNLNVHRFEDYSTISTFLENYEDEKCD